MPCRNPIFSGNPDALRLTIFLIGANFMTQLSSNQDPAGQQSLPINGVYLQMIMHTYENYSTYIDDLRNGKVTIEEDDLFRRKRRPAYS